MEIRRPHFAGAWYPDQEGACLAELDRYEACAVPYQGESPLVGGLVPHAGWTFSGRLAFNTIREVARSMGDGGDLTVALLGGHLGPRSPAGLLTRGEIWTPLGPIQTDSELANALARRVDLVLHGPEDHPQDNTVELQFPIIRKLMPTARLLVIGAPANPGSFELAHALVQEAQGLGRRLAVIGSTDLTHYGPNYGWTPRGRGEEAEQWVRQENDARLLELAGNLDHDGLLVEALTSQNACCPGAAAAAIYAAKALGATSGHVLSYATSSDVHKSDSFVGYASVVF